MAVYHEDPARLPAATLDLHRALRSLVEELDAIDWYQQRIVASGDEELRHILGHNRDEEVEHASLLMEWIRRHDPHFDRNLRKYLFTRGDPVHMEAAEREESATASQVDGGGI